MQKATLNELISQFEQNYSLDKLSKAQELHEQFLAEFPFERLKSMNVDEYALGRSKQGSYCWWLEYNTLLLGSIQGGSATKLIIYYSVKDNEWKFPSKFNSVQEAWDKLRSDIIMLVETYQGEPYKPIDDDNLLFFANMIRGKTLYLYLPDKFMPIYSLSHLQHFLQALGVPEEQWQDKDNIECNLLLKKTVSEMPEFEGWHSVKVQAFLYQATLKKIKYYKISPGPDATYWEECREGGYISIAYNELGDLKQYPDYEEFKAAFFQQNYYDSTSKSTEKANDVWLFYNLRPGDKVIANRGKTQVLAIGTIKEEAYAYRDDLESQKHVVYVNWEKIFDPPRLIERQGYWGVKTIVELSEKEFIKFTEGELKDKHVFTSQEESFFGRMEKALERKRQCVLFGPPGTGKTYLARKYIKWKNIKENLDQPMEDTSQRLWMVVASAKQDFQWESILDNKDIIDYSLKTIRSNFKKAQTGDKVLCYRGGDVNRAFVGLAEIEAPFDGNYLKIRGVRPFKEPIDFDQVKDSVEYKTSQPGRMGNRGTMFEVSRDLELWLIDYLYEIGDIDAVKILAEAAEKNNSEMCTFHPSFNYEDFIEGYKPVQDENGQVFFQLETGLFAKLCELAREYKTRPYFLIIDEINRGNIPKIFGEIITLLEKDKRNVEVMLPQSKVLFSVPDNLYIIATMNTADRSIKIMDAALKRRFAFIECMPDLTLINKKIDELNLSPADILENINRRLVDFSGRDKQIGHSYFMENSVQINTVTQLKEVIELDLIPLIQEYCFDDYQQLSEIIGLGFIDVERNEIKSSVFHGPDDIFIAEINKHFKGASDEENL